MTTDHFSDLHITFWNSRGIFKKKEELSKRIADQDIFISVESWLTKDKTFDIPGFHTFRLDRDTHRGGGIIYLIKKQIFFKPVSLFCKISNKLEIAAVEILNAPTKLFILTCYRVPNHHVSEQEWNHLFAAFSSLGPCLIMGDFNAHHPSWNSQKYDPPGIALFNAFNSSDLILVNEHTSTHIDFYRNTFSNLDLLLSSPDLLDKIDLQVSDDLRGSDHYPLLIIVSSTKHKNTHLKKKL
ncbi:uncharacterized protein [Prorops nasuta]|uniref:uncharacterized protein n=1 Tax=Prorops nasuta TaxID=863751 RepID=UPI0034CE3447